MLACTNVHCTLSKALKGRSPIKIDEFVFFQPQKNYCRSGGFMDFLPLYPMERKLQIVSFPRSETGSYGVEIAKHAFAIHKWLSGVLKFSQFSVHFKITSSEGELIHLTQGKPSARKVVRDHTRLPEISVGSQGDGRHCVKV